MCSTQCLIHSVLCVFVEYSVRHVYSVKWDDIIVINTHVCFVKCDDIIVFNTHVCSVKCDDIIVFNTHVCSVKWAAGNIGGGQRTCLEYLITSTVGISYTLKIPDWRNITKSPLHRILHNRSP